MNTLEKTLSGISLVAAILIVMLLAKSSPVAKYGDIPTQPIYAQEVPSTLACSSTASVSVVPQEVSRSYIRITNLSTTNTVFLGLNATATKNAGIAIPALTSWETNSSFLYAGAINCIASSSAASTSVQDVI